MEVLAQWGPAGVTLSVLILIIKWFMAFIDGQAKRIEKMADSFNSTMQNYTQENTKILVETKDAVAELKFYLIKANKKGSLS